MNVIYKYPIPIMGEFGIELPIGAEVLHVDMQYGEPQIWALVTPPNPRHVRRFRLVGTGRHIEGGFDKRYIGTFQMQDGALVFHLFEIG